MTGTKKRQKSYIIATIKPWNIQAAEKFISGHPEYKTAVIIRPKDFSYRKVRAFSPRYIFFPHWSWIIPEDIYKGFECVVFHMTDLPFGRGGSPLQNLIIRGVKKTKISAIRVTEALDAGAVYIKRGLSLSGSAREIYKRASDIIFKDMIPYIIKNEPRPLVQKGRAVIFERRRPGQSRIPRRSDLNRVYDHIRMLDADGYPPAFIDTQRCRFEFTDAVKRGGRIDARVSISKRNIMDRGDYEAAKIALNRADKSDCRDLWRWRNNPRIRRNFFDNRPVSWKAHKDWFYSKINDKDTRIYIANIGGKKIGVIRFESRDHLVSVSVNLNPLFFGRRLGGRLIELGTKSFLSESKTPKPIIAQIKRDNTASEKAFFKAGYRRIEEAEAKSIYAYTKKRPHVKFKKAE